MPGFLGRGLTDGTVIYVPIPKVGSTSHRSAFRRAGWEPASFGVSVETREAYIPIRHPVERWFSGLDQYARTERRSYDELLERFVAGTSQGQPYPVFDENTAPQADYIFRVLANPTFVRLENTTEYVADRWGLELQRKNGRFRHTDDSITEVLMDFYAEDLALWEAAS